MSRRKARVDATPDHHRAGRAAEQSKGASTPRLLDKRPRPTGLRLLDTLHSIGVWPDSIQVFGGNALSRLPTRLRAWLSTGLRTVGHRDEARRRW